MKIDIEEYSIYVTDEHDNRLLVLDGKHPVFNLSDCELQSFNGSVSLAEKIISIFEKNSQTVGSKVRALNCFTVNCILGNFLTGMTTVPKTLIMGENVRDYIKNINDVMSLFNKGFFLDYTEDASIESSALTEFGIILVENNTYVTQSMVKSIAQNCGLLIIAENDFTNFKEIWSFSEPNGVLEKKIYYSETSGIYALDFSPFQNEKKKECLNNKIAMLSAVDSSDRNGLADLLEEINMNINKAAESGEIDEKVNLIDCREKVINRMINDINSHQ